MHGSQRGHRGSGEHHRRGLDRELGLDRLGGSARRALAGVVDRDLLRAYATEQAHTTDPDQQRHAATHRLLDHYLHTAHTASRLLDPRQHPITLTPPLPGIIPEHPTDYEQDHYEVQPDELVAELNGVGDPARITAPLKRYRALKR